LEINVELKPPFQVAFQFLDRKQGLASKMPCRRSSPWTKKWV